jgi:serine/threonine protein kinase
MKLMGEIRGKSDSIDDRTVDLSGSLGAVENPPPFEHGLKRGDSVEDQVARERVKKKLFGRSRKRSIGPYEIIEKVGEGGMGVVYKARDSELGRIVALKVLSAPTLASAKRLLREAKAMARLNHPNVVAIHEVVRDQDQISLAMEFVEGVTLARWLEASHSRSAIAGAFIQAAQGLLAAHERNIIHRDFKPQNVLVGDDGRVRILDFGLATAVLAEDVSSDSLRSWERITVSGVVMGTPRYMAPEQFRSDPCDQRTDQFSFCMSLYEALFNKRPFGGGETNTDGHLVLQGQVNPPPEHTQVSPELVETLMTGLSVKPKDRHPSMQPLLQALEREANSTDS